MTWFCARTVARSSVPVPPNAIWRVLTDPTTLAELTPLVHSIEPDGEHWRWTLHGIDGLGVRVRATFTEQMTFIEERRIEFVPAPPPGKPERAAVDGIYTLEPTDGGCDVGIDLTARVDLPLPGVARRSVEGLMERQCGRPVLVLRQISTNTSVSTQRMPTLATGAPHDEGNRQQMSESTSP